MTIVITVEQGEDLAARILAAIGNADSDAAYWGDVQEQEGVRELTAVDRLRVAADLASLHRAWNGLADHRAYLGEENRGCSCDSFGRMQYGGPNPASACSDVIRYTAFAQAAYDNLVDMANRYDVTL